MQGVRECWAAHAVAESLESHMRENQQTGHTQTRCSIRHVTFVVRVNLCGEQVRCGKFNCARRRRIHRPVCKGCCTSPHLCLITSLFVAALRVQPRCRR